MTWPLGCLCRYENRRTKLPQRYNHAAQIAVVNTSCHQCCMRSGIGLVGERGARLAHQPVVGLQGLAAGVGPAGEALRAADKMSETAAQHGDVCTRNIFQQVL